MAGVRMLLTRWRADRGLLVLLVVVVTVTAGLAGAVPRMLGALQASSLATALDDVTVDRLGASASVVDVLTAPDPLRGLARLRSQATDVGERIGPDLRAVLRPPVAVVDSVRYDLLPLPDQPPDPFNRKLTLRMQEDAAEHVTLVEGVLPDGLVDTYVLPTGSFEEDGAPIVQEVPLHQFAATAETAEAMGLAVGDLRVGVPDPDGPIASRVGFPPSQVVVWQLSGIVALSDPGEPEWFGDMRLHRPTRFDTNVGTTIFGFGLLLPDAMTELPGMVEGQLSGMSWRWVLDREALLRGDVAAIADDARSLRTQTAVQLEAPRWSTGLDRVLDGEAARRATALEALGLGAVAVVGVATALLVVVAGLLAGRRRDAVALVRSRGASRAQLLVAASVESTLVAGVGAAVAVGVLTVAVEGEGGQRIVLAVAALAAVVLVLGGWPDVRRSLGELLGARRRGGDVQPARHVRDGMLVIIAAVAASALRRRGIAVDGEADMLVVGAPVLVALAAAVLVARLLPVPLRALAVAVRRWPSLAVGLGVVRAARSSRDAGVVVLVVLGLSVAGIAAAFRTTLVDGQVRAAQERVGADVRVDAPPLATLEAGWDPPVADASVADLSVFDATLVTDSGAARVTVLLVDPAAIEALGNDDGTLPPLAWDGVAPAPVIVSAVLKPAGSPDVEDDVFVAIGLQQVPGTIVAVDPRVLGLDMEQDGPFVVMDRSAMAAAGIDPGATSRLVGTSDPAAVAAAARAADPEVDVQVRADIVEQLGRAPLARGVELGFDVAAVAAVVATLLALALALAASAPVRRREAAVLAAVGTQRSGIRTALLAELYPVVGAAALAGLGLAAVLARLLRGRLDLAAFTGTVGVTDLGPPPTWVGLLLVVGALVVTTVAAVLTLGRVDPGALLREGDQ